MREQARNKYRELSNEEKDIKREYGTNSYQKMPKQNKQRIKENKKIYITVKQKKWNKKPWFLIRIDKIKTERIALSKIHSYDNKGLFNFFIGYVTECNV